MPANIAAKRIDLAARVLLTLAGLALTLFLYKSLPGYAPSAQYLTGDAAFADCYANSSGPAPTKCLNFGFPQGAPKTFGIPVAVIGQYLAQDHVVSLTTITLIYALILAAAYCGSILLFKKITQHYWLALAGTLLFLSNITVHKFIGYGSLGLGIALIPTYLLIDLKLLESCKSEKSKSLMIWFAIATLSRCFAVFLDGYSFLFSCALSFSCFTIPPLITRDYRALFRGSAYYVTACAVAAICYRGYFPSNAMGSTPLDGFRAQGVDVFALLWPQTDSIYHTVFGIGSDIDPQITYSDGSSCHGIFLGYSWLIGASVVVAHIIRKKARHLPPYFTPIIISGVVALTLSLGPSLKFKSFKSSPSPTFTYSMPKEDALIALPTAPIFTHIPGIKTARGLVRWLVVWRLAAALLIIIAALIFIEKKKNIPAVLLIAFALLESLPNFSDYYASAKSAYARAYTLYYDYPASLEQGMRPHERAFFLELQDNPGGNQYTVNTLCARADIFCYNTGGDKAYSFVKHYWPREVQDLANHQNVHTSIDSLFSKRMIDVVVIPFFDLRFSAYSEAQGRVDIEQVIARAKSLANDLGLQLTIGDRFAYLRPKQSENSDLTAVVRGASPLWGSWKEMDVATPDWGPMTAARGKRINPQPDGSSVIWIAMQDKRHALSVAIDGHLLPTRSDKSKITAVVPSHLQDSFIPGAEYRVDLVDLRSHEQKQLPPLKISGP